MAPDTTPKSSVPATNHLEKRGNVRKHGFRVLNFHAGGVRCACIQQQIAIPQFRLCARSAARTANFLPNEKRVDLNDRPVSLQLHQNEKLYFASSPAAGSVAFSGAVFPPP